MKIRCTKEAKMAVEELKDRYDYILSLDKFGDFIVVVGSIGGDIEQRRVYPDGSVYAK